MSPLPTRMIDSISRVRIWGCELLTVVDWGWDRLTKSEMLVTVGRMLRMTSGFSYLGVTAMTNPTDTVCRVVV